MSYHFATQGLNLFHYLKNRELDELYISTFIKTLARSLVLVFIPIYLSTIGFSIRFVAFFFLLEFIGMAIATPLGLYLNSTLGVKKTMAVSDVVFVAYMIAVSYLKAPSWYLLVPTLLFAISSGLFWAAYHVDFTINADRQAEGRELSVIKSLIVLASALGPFVGSLVIVGSSYAASFMAAATLSMLAVLPLFFTPDFKTPRPKFSWRKLKKADDKEKASSYIGYGVMQLSNETLWPLYVYLVIHSVLEIGAVFSITTLLMIIVIIWYGRRVDQSPRRALISGVWLHAPSWLIRIFLVTPLGFFAANTYGQLTYQALDTAFEKVVYAEAKQSSDVAHYFLFRQLYIGIGRLAACAIVLVTGRIEYAFILTFVVLFAHLGLSKRLPA